MSLTPRIQYDPSQLASHYERLHFRVTHNLVDHPLFTMDSIKALARALPPQDIELNAGDVPASLPQGKKPEHALSALEALEQIDTCRTWVGLKKVGQVPAWGELLDTLLDGVQRDLGARDPGMSQREGFLFITSPGSTVPIHVDPELNFLLQIRGRKSAWLYRRDDSAVITQEEVERHYMKVNRKLCVHPEVLQARGQEVVLEPGQGVHIPTMAPHMLQNQELSISLSVTFATPRSKAREDLFRVNYGLRRLGLRPAAVGSHPGRDAAKLRLAQGMRAAKRRLLPGVTLYEN